VASPSCSSDSSGLAGGCGPLNLLRCGPRLRSSAPAAGTPDRLQSPSIPRNHCCCHAAAVARAVDSHGRPLSYAGTAALAGTAWLAISRGLAARGAPPVPPLALLQVTAAV
jgi:hypothetical protein